MVHHHLKGAGRVSKAEEHDQWLEETVFHFERSFFLISSLNPNIVVTPLHIKLCEDVHVLHLTDQVGNER